MKIKHKRPKLWKGDVKMKELELVVVQNDLFLFYVAAPDGKFIKQRSSFPPSN